MKIKSANEKLARMMVATLFKWLAWCLVNKPKDFGSTMKELDKFTNEFGKLLNKTKDDHQNEN